ncbi:nucleotide sugar dehydrogenase [Aneurinibacillus terranovensis]|uniref:nucleotide sugar dehydrogenase n=1 Tax=Aneurinibacillus terranovensis TaxID=278991 RepID=UPI0003FF19A1|nr:nucleotide sugar dehydrogenase [Aneurinibacillus terranovensis]
MEKKIAVIGLGYVGLPLASMLVKSGHQVVGIDIDSKKVESLYAKKSYLSDITDSEIGELIDSGRFAATVDYAQVSAVTYVIICVPTPLRNKNPDLSYIHSAIHHIRAFLRPGHVIVLESSTYPGTTEDYVQPLIETDSLQVGKTIYLGYSPERIDPGNKDISVESIPKIISGVTPGCLKQIHHLYSNVFRTVVPVSSPRVAEFAKMLENSQRLINISFMNEINILANKMKVNLWEVIEAAKTKPMGFTPYYPSAGIGGHCIPVDPFFLSWIGMQEGVPLTMIHQAGLINEMIPHVVVSHVVHELGRRNIPMVNAKVGVIGLTYKKDVNDIRESAAVKVVELLQNRRIHVSVHEPVYQGNLPKAAAHFDITQEGLSQFDIVLILVDHSNIAWEDVARYGRCVIDTRNVTDGLPGDHIVRL